MIEIYGCPYYFSFLFNKAYLPLVLLNQVDLVRRLKLVMGDDAQVKYKQLVSCKSYET